MNRIKELRKLNNMNQEDLASLLNIQRSGISKYETGKVPLTGDTLSKLSEIFHVTIDYLLCKSDHSTPFESKGRPESEVNSGREMNILKLQELAEGLTLENLEILVKIAKSLNSEHTE